MEIKLAWLQFTKSLELDKREKYIMPIIYIWLTVLVILTIIEILKEI